MYILSDKKSKIWYFLIGLIFIISSYVSAQNNPVKVAITVVPPYTSAIADYVYTPNKVVASLTNTGRSDFDLYLRGSITSDEGIVIKTSDSYKPANPVHLSQGMIYSLTPDNIQSMFDINALDVVGIDLQDLLNGAGLPEDNYQICIRAYDFYTNQPISDEEPLGCSNYFMVTNIEPPIITLPICGDSVSIQPFQNVMISWTIPAGAPGAQYKFELIEIPDGMDINPNNAFESGAFPPFYEETVSFNLINLTADKVILTPGYTYAFRVQAFDPFNTLNLRNSGYSEVCYFICANETRYEFGNTGNENGFSDNLSDLEKQMELLPITTISGQLLAKFPDNPNEGYTAFSGSAGNSAPMTAGSDILEQDGSSRQTLSNNKLQNENGISNDIHKEFAYDLVTETAEKIYSDINSNKHSYTSSVNIPTANLSQGSLQLVSRKPYYYYSNTEEIVHTKPLANMDIRLVARFAVNTAGAEWGIGSPQYRDPNTGELLMGVSDLNNEARNPFDIINVVVATTTTDENGNYNFTFNTDFFTGKSIVKSMGEGHYEQDQYKENPLDKLGWGMDEVYPGNDFNSIENILGEQTQSSNPIALSGQFMSASEITQQYDAFANIASNQALNPANQQHAGGQQTMSWVPGPESTYPAYICLKIEVVNQKFCSPDVDIFAMPGDVLEVPTQVAKLKTYNLTVTPTSSDDDYQQIAKNKPMDNVRVHIFRDMQTIDQELDMIIDYEGQRLKTQTINENGAFKDVAIDTTKSGDSTFVRIENLVCHANFNPQYFIEVSTRNLKDATSDYENTLYNYETVSTEVETQQMNDASDPTTIFYNGNRHVMYNRDYIVPEISYNPVMVPKWPEIKGRAMAMSNMENIGMKDVRVQLIKEPDNSHDYESGPDFQWEMAINPQNYTQEREMHTVENGFFSFDNLNLNVSGQSVVGPFRRVLLTRQSYESVIRPAPGFPPLKLMRGMLVDFKDVDMVPARLIKGYIVDEEGNPVPAYVKTDYTPFYTTKPELLSGIYHQFFRVPSVLFGKNHIIIHPKSSQYFKCDTTIGTNSALNYKIIVYKKLHRPRIVVKKPNGSVLSGVTVELGEETAKTTNNQGVAQFKYASPGDQVIIKITPPAGYAPVQKPLNIPVTPHDTIFTFVLEYAHSIEGTITEKTSHEPLPGAIVYTELENTDGTILYVEAISDQEGKYILSGIPNSFTSVEVFAVKKGNNPSYVGASSTINFSSSPQSMMPPRYNFELKRMDDWDLSSIWGYPVVVNAFRQSKSNANEFLIDGYFYNPPVKEGFTLQQPNIKLPFKYITVKKSPSGKIEPVAPDIELDVNQIPLTVNETFTGILYNHKQVSSGPYIMNSLGLHKIVKQDGYAVLQGILKLNLNSFKFAYNFNGELYAGNKDLGNKVEAFKALSIDLDHVDFGSHAQTATFGRSSQDHSAHYNETGQTNYTQQGLAEQAISGTTFEPNNSSIVSNNFVSLSRLEIFSLNSSFQPVPIKNYEVFNFPATSRPDGAFLIQDKIWIQTILHTCLPIQNLDLKIPAGSILITKNDINVVKSTSDTLSFDLEQWKVINQKEWNFDKNEDAIVLDEALILTGSGINAKIKKLKIRPDWIGEGDIDMSPGGLSLGGVAKITINPDLEPVFNYDATGHYRISFVGSTSADKPAGTVEQLPAMEAGKYIKFQSIGMLSNGNNILTINDKPKFYNILELEVFQIVSGNGYFMLQGNPNLNIPKFNPDPAIMEYRLGNQGGIDAVPPKIGGTINATGFVTYTLQPEGQVLQKNLFTSYGQLTVSPDAINSSKAFSFSAELTRKPNECRMDLKVNNDGNQEQNFKSGKNIIKVFEGSMTTNTGFTAWNNLTYKGKTSAIDGLNKPGSNNVLDFIVDGAIQATSSSLQVSNIDVGLGQMSLTYDFDNSSLHGTLDVKNIPLGFAYINEGQLSVMFDNSGYYLLGRVYANLLNLVPADCGFIFGNSTNVDQTDANILISNFHNSHKPDLKTIKGAYFIGELKLIDKTVDTPLDILDVGLKAGIGSYYQMSLEPDSNTVTIGGYIYGDAWGGISVEVAGIGCSAGVGTYIHGEATGTYNLSSKELFIDACTDGKIRVHVCGLGTGFGFHVNANGYTDGNDLKIKMGYGWNPCE